MDNIPRGECLILNVIEAKNCTPLHGYEKDGDGLEDLFKNTLHFVTTRIDATSPSDLTAEVQCVISINVSPPTHPAPYK